MGRGKHRTDVFRGQVQSFRDLGLKNSEIARRLGCSHKKVINAINLFNVTGSLSNKKRKSRERKTTPREDAAIVRIAKLNPFVGAPKIKEQIAQNLKLNLSVSTVKSRLREIGRNINRSTATNLDRLWVEIKAAWDAITPERCQKLISMGPSFSSSY